MKREYRFYVYIMASKSRVIYTGMTNNIEKRVWQHKNNLIEGFTKKYKCHRLVHRESFDDVRSAINREKEIKSWTRAKKVALIEATNPVWDDLAAEWFVHHRYEPPEQVDGVRKKQVPRCARDDTGEKIGDRLGQFGGADEKQVPPLRFAQGRNDTP